MLKRKNKKLLAFFFLFSFFAVPCALAKKFTFESMSPFGLGLRAGLAEAPEQSFTVDPQTTSSSYSKFYGLEPFADFGNFALHGSFLLHKHPLFSGSGSDTGTSFSESSDASSTTYGLRLLLIPHRFTNDRARIYVGFGGGIASLSASNTRSYKNAAGVVTNTYSEKVKSSSQYLESFLGFEFFLVQNYSLGIEAGYRNMRFDSPEYANDKNVRGQTVVEGSEVKAANGTILAFSQSGFNTALNFNLHF